MGDNGVSRVAAPQYANQEIAETTNLWAVLLKGSIASNPVYCVLMGVVCIKRRCGLVYFWQIAILGTVR